MEWKTSQSADRPEEFDTTSSKVYNYARRNIVEDTIEDTGGGTMTVYNYEELKVAKESWPFYIGLEQAKADIDYLNMVTEE